MTSSPVASPWELFHQVAHPASAKVRRYVVDQSLDAQLRFRNVVYPDVQTDFAARGGHTLPALWDGQTLFQGAEAVIARLSSQVDIGRS